MSAIVWQAGAHLLAYPDERFWGRLPMIRDIVQPHFGDFLDQATELGAGELAAQYVDTFDLKRRCCLYLTYYTDGDTRQRGESLARLKARFRAAGWELCEDELPDFLPVVLEFAALDPSGVDVLREHRAGLELLRTALHEYGSPYASVIDVICGTLPRVTDAELRAAARLAEQGPPAESVGAYT